VRAPPARGGEQDSRGDHGTATISSLDGMLAPHGFRVRMLSLAMPIRHTVPACCALGGEQRGEEDRPRAGEERAAVYH